VDNLALLIFAVPFSKNNKSAKIKCAKCGLAKEIFKNAKRGLSVFLFCLSVSS
jgi:hypothetical protein